MPVAVQLYFDAATDAAVRVVWRRLAEEQIAPYLHTSANRPHLTMALYEQLAVEDSDAALAGLAREVAPVPLMFGHLGVFPAATDAVLFCAPISTPALRAIHEQVHARVDGFAQTPDERYAPGNWIPHGSLATHCPSARLTQALEVSLRLPLPLSGQVVAVGITYTSPARPYSTHRLQSGGA
jgi:hypothetical protein